MEFPHPSEISAKRRRIFIALAIVALLAGGLVYACWPDGPYYQGRALSSWLTDYSDPLAGARNVRSLRFDFGERMNAAHAAVQVIGTNALPTLLKYAAARDSAPKKLLLSLTHRTPLLRDCIRSETEKFKAAQGGFVILNHNAAPAVPALFELAKSTDPKIRLHACLCLEPILAPDVKPLIPILVSFGHEPDLEIRDEAGMQLRLLGNFLTDDEAQKAGVFEAFPEFRDPKRASAAPQ